jgi:hypothetical protein
VKNASILTVAAVLALVATSGCSNSERPATWAYISPVIFQPNCATASCHSRGAAVSGLDFSDPDRGYTSLTGLWVWIVDPTMAGVAGCGHAAGTVVCERQYRPLVTPYDPSASRLINVLRGRDAPRMPPDRPLDEADIRLVENWILNGARKTETATTTNVDAGADGAKAGDAAGTDADGASTDATGGGDAAGDARDATDATDTGGGGG